MLLRRIFNLNPFHFNIFFQRLIKNANKNNNKKPKMTFEKDDLTPEWLREEIKTGVGPHFFRF